MMAKRLQRLTALACLALAACGTLPSAPATSVVPMPSLVAPETTAQPATTQDAQHGLSQSATPTPIAPIPLIVDLESNPDLFARLTQADAGADLPPSFRSTFRLRQSAELGDISAKSSLDVESLRLSSGDLRLRVLDKTEEMGQTSLLEQELVKLNNITYYAVLTETLSQQDAICTQIFDLETSKAVLADVPSAEQFGGLMLSDVFSLTLVARGVVVNNFQADQYDFLTSLGEQSNGGAELGYYSSGSVWFSRDLWAVVRHEGRFKGSLRLSDSSDDEPLNGDFTWIYELTPPDDKPPVPPSACDLSRQWQAPEGTLVAVWSSSGSAVIAVRSTTIEALVNYYDKAAEERGWVKQYLERNSDTIVSMVYSSEGRKMVVILQENRPNDNILVYITSETQE